MPDFTRKLTVLSCLLFTGFCFWKAALGLVDGADASVVSTTEAAVSPSFSHKRGITTPIQDMRPGMRIVGRNPNRLETESTIDPTPEGWRLLSVRMLKADGTYFEAELLRPLSWIRRHRAQPGATIQLNMPELHVVGAAEVLSISDCPPIDPGDGPVVISTFKNVSNNVLNIYVEGEETPIGVTAGHPIWSEDRQAFVHSEKLSVGEKLRSALGRTVRITSIEPRAGPEAVYNLEVAGEHVYSVTDAGLLVHNMCPPGVPDLYVFDKGSRSARLISSADKGASQYSFEELKELAATSLDFSTKKHGAVFWAGDRMEVAQKWARKRGKTTIEQTTGGKFLEKLDLFNQFTGEQASEIWDIASARFASSASGNANVFSTGTSKINKYGNLRTWWRVEQKILKSNPAVNKITRRRIDGKQVGSSR